MNTLKFLLSALTILLFCSSAYSQVNTVKTAGTGMFYLQTESGDTLHVRGVTPFYNEFHVAHNDAQIYSAENLERVYVRQVPAEFRVDADFGYFDDYIEVIYDTLYIPVPGDTLFITDTLYVETEVPVPGDTAYVEVPIDTVYVEADTVYLEAPVTGLESEILNSFNLQHTQYISGEHHIDVEWNSIAEYNDLLWRCVDEVPDDMDGWVWEYVDDDVVYLRQEDIEHHYNFTTDCNRYLYVHLWVQTPGWSVRKSEFLNLGLLDDLFDSDTAEPGETHFFTDFSDYDPDEWQNTWGDLTWYVNEETLYVDQPRNIARLKWLRIPEHRNARFRIVETIHESHSTGVHAGLRVSDSDRQYAVETFIQSTGMGVSTFFNGGWENPVDFPFDWSYGDTVEYELILVNDTMTIRYNGEEHEYRHPDIGNTPNGFFAFGSTGAGTYIIHEIEVEILD
jgi:hypothetical protein